MSAEHDDAEALRRETEEIMSQRLYSIVLAVHAAEANLAGDPTRLEAILELIRVQSAASLEDLRLLRGLR